MTAAAHERSDSHTTYGIDVQDHSVLTHALHG
jgi:hypothetical protein